MCADLGVELHAGEALRDILERGHRRAGRGGGDREPCGAAVTQSPWLIQTFCSAASPSKSRPRLRLALTAGAAELPLPGVGDRAAQRQRHRLEAVADAEQGYAAVEQLGVDLRAPGS